MQIGTQWGRLGVIVDYVEFMFWKLVAVAALAFVWNFWKAFTGR